MAKQRNSTDTKIPQRYIFDTSSCSDASVAVDKTKIIKNAAELAIGEINPDISLTNLATKVVQWPSFPKDKKRASVSTSLLVNESIQEQTQDGELTPIKDEAISLVSFDDSTKELILGFDLKDHLEDPQSEISVVLEENNLSIDSERTAHEERNDEDGSVPKELTSSILRENRSYDQQILTKRISRSNFTNFKDLLLSSTRSDQTEITVPSKEKILELEVFEPDHSPTLADIPTLELTELGEETPNESDLQTFSSISLSSEEHIKRQHRSPSHIVVKLKNYWERKVSESRNHENTNEVLAGDKSKWRRMFRKPHSETRKCCDTHESEFCDDCTYIVGSAKSSGALKSPEMFSPYLGYDGSPTSQEYMMILLCNNPS